MHEPIDPDAELNEVRNQIATSNTDVSPPGIVAEIDNERAWLHDEQRGGIAALLLWSAGISPHRVEHAW